MRVCSIRRTAAPPPRAASRSSRIACTSRVSSRFWPHAPAMPSIEQTRSRNGTHFCSHRPISAMSESRRLEPPRHYETGITMNRRHMLKVGSAALLSAGVRGRLFAAPTAGPRFLLVFLRGGYDSTNLLVPYLSSYYYEARPNIAIARPDAASSTGALALNADWALAPAVRDTIGAMYLERQVAFIPFAGTDD